MEQEMKILISDGKNIVKTWKTYSWLIAVISVVGFILGIILTFYPDADRYAATASIYSYSIYGEDMSAVSALVKTSQICEKAAELINDEFITEEKIKNMIHVEYSTNSLILYISAYSESTDEAIKVVNSVSHTFVNVINNEKGNNSVKILDQAKSAYIYDRGIIKQWLIRIAMGVVFGIVTSVILAIKSIITKEIIVAEDFTCDGSLQVIGMIPRYYTN